MTLEEIQAKLKSGIENSEVTMEGDGCNCSALIISPKFNGMSLLERQKAVLAIVSEDIKSGELHALSIKARTPEEIALSIMAEIVAFRLGGDGGKLTIDQRLIDKAAAKAKRQHTGVESVSVD